MNAITTITFSTTQNSENRLATAISEANETLSTIQALLATQNETARSIAANETLKHKYQIGRIYGTLKAYLDCMPDKIASNQKINGIPLNFWIKMKVDEHVLDILEKTKGYVYAHFNSVDHKGIYEKLPYQIFTYSFTYNEKKFKDCFPNNTHEFVLGFSESYSEVFHEIAAFKQIETDCTDPKMQDIWRNWEYFFKRDVSDYRIDGEFLLLKDGPYATSVYKFMNKDVYENIRSYDDSEFTETAFDFKF